jgi:putative molybdopterin biosynthesis protein
MEACASAGWKAGLVPSRVPVTAALGRVTIRDVRARWASPRVACAAMDGIAFLASDAAGTRPEQWRLPAGVYCLIDTGDPLPPGADTVIQRERVAIEPDGSALVSGPAPRGLNVRPTGEDFRAGDLLVPASRRLRPGDLGAVAAAGHATVEVARQPVVAIIPTGDEIRPVGVSLRSGEITDSNSVMLAARAVQVGAIPVVSDVQPDEPDALAAELRRAALDADLVLVIAGSSRGRDDYASAVLAQVGGIAVHGAAIRPGHPVLLGHVKRGSSGAGTVPVIGVPGYPLAAAVVFERFAIPLLDSMEGADGTRGRPAQARLTRDWASSPDVEDWIPVTLEAPAFPGDAQVPEVTPARHRAGSTSWLARADAWWVIPVGQGTFRRGDLVAIRPQA